jgi:hypothetical protein
MCGLFRDILNCNGWTFAQSKQNGTCALVGSGAACLVLVLAALTLGTADSANAPSGSVYFSRMPTNFFISSSSEIIVSNSGAIGTSVATVSRRTTSFVIGMMRMA